MATSSDKLPTIWIVYADHWPRAELRAELIERGYDAVGVVTLEQALARLVGRHAEPPLLMLIVLDGQTVNERQHALCTRKGVRIALTGSEVALNAEAVRGFAAAAVLPRRVTLGELAATVERLLPLRA